MLEKYNPDTCTFLTPVGEMGFALHEMVEVLGLSMGDLSYENYIPDTEELHLLKKDVLPVYKTYWKILCHLLKQPGEGLGELSRCHGLTNSFRVWERS